MQWNYEMNRLPFELQLLWSITLRVYIAVAGGDHSKPWSPPSEGEGDPHSLTGNPHPGGNTLHCLQAELGNLADQELWQLMEDLHQEITLHGLHTPPSNPQPTPWGEPSGKGNTNGDDPEVTFPRGEGGFPKGNHLQLQLQHNQVEGGFLRNHLLSLWGLLWQIQHLINTLALGLHLGTPRINTFSGEAMPGKTEVSFEQWYHEVQCIKDHYPESVVWESMVWSVKGAVVDMAWYMGPTASVSEILQKLMVILGTVAFLMSLCKISTRLQGYLGKPWESALLFHKTGGDFKSNSAQVPQKDSRPWDGMPPQRLTFPQGMQTHKRFN